MKDNNLIKKLVQARKIQATANNTNSKLVLIAKTYGSPIMGHYYDSPLMDADWDDFNNPETDWSKMDEMEDNNIPKLGFIYDSLKLGTNLEIVVLVREIKNLKTAKKELDKPTKVKCSYKGYTVYHEEEGNLICYAPFPEWENHVDQVYAKATGTDKKRNDIKKYEEEVTRKKATQKALTTLRRLWGI